MTDVIRSDDLSAETAGPLLYAAHDLVQRMPALLAAARRLAATQLQGIHSRRRAGPGDDFWQYRRYAFGEPAASIDWRRSARGDHTFVREKEWQATHGFWFWADISASMAIRSKLAHHSKRDAALITVFAAADRLVDLGERAGLLGLTPALASRTIASRFAQEICLHQHNALPAAVPAPRFSDSVIVSDFLNDTDDLLARCAQISSEGARIHLVHILDPVEEIFPFAGRMQFVDPETGIEFLAGRAETYARRYKWALEALKTKLRTTARANGWTYRLHNTSAPLTTLLLPLLLHLTQLPHTSSQARN